MRALAIEPFDARRALDLVLAGLGDRRERVVVEAADLRVLGDVEATRRVLADVLENALVYSEAAVRVEVAAAGGHARFAIADDGPGIPAAERDRIFDRFYRLDPDQRRGVGGLGLGLAIARGLVTAMGGRIGLLPRSRGTAVFVDLPLGR